MVRKKDRVRDIKGGSYLCLREIAKDGRALRDVPTTEECQKVTSSARAVVYLHPIVFIVRGYSVRGATKNCNGAPSQGFVDQGLEVREAIAVFEPREAVRTDDAIEFSLSLSHDFREV